MLPLSLLTQRPSPGQSRSFSHSLWQRAKVQTSGSSQFELSEHPSASLPFLTVESELEQAPTKTAKEAKLDTSTTVPRAHERKLCIWLC